MEIRSISTLVRSLLAPLAVVVMVATLTVAAPSSAEAASWWGSFEDDDSSAHQAAIEALVTAGITGGCASEPDRPRFCPTSKITRGQMAAFLSRALDLPPAPAAGFVDTATSNFAADIDAVAAAGITRGCEPGRFCPDRRLTRGEMAALLVQAFAPEATRPEGDRFVDDDDTVFEDQIEILADLGITEGCGRADGYFCPREQVNRAQMASFLARALDLALPEVPVAEPAPGPVVETPPVFDTGADPLGLIGRAEHLRRFAHGEDRWTVVVCRVPVLTADPWFASFGPERVPVSPKDAVAFLQGGAVDYFAWLSDGAYVPTFTAGGFVTAATTAPDVWTDCEDKGKAKAAGAEGAFVIMDVAYGGGRGGNGTMCAPVPCQVDSVLPGSSRGLIVGALAVVPRGRTPAYLSTVVHEMGHALGFPHSYAAGTTDEYTDPIDMMSGGKPDWAGGPEGTLAVNRYAAGWVGSSRAVVHQGGTREYTVGGMGYAGKQLVAVPAGHADAFTALGAIHRDGYDAVQPVEGITLHRVDQRAPLCDLGDVFGCVGSQRRHAPMGPPDATDHVLGVGESRDLGGVVVTVLARAGDAFRIRVTGATAPFAPVR